MGQPLVVENQLVGMLAIFDKQPMANNMLNTLTAIADGIALAIDRKQAHSQTIRSTQEAQLLHQIAFIASDSDSFDDALQLCITTICELISWPVGHVYLIDDDDPNELIPTDIWHLEDRERYTDIRKTFEYTCFRIGVGMPGRILKSGRSEWITNVQLDSSFQRTKLCSNLQIRTAIGIPIKSHDAVVAILEFFTHDVQEIYHALLNTIESAGEQLGRMLERKEIQLALRESESRTRAVFESMVDSIISINEQGMIETVNYATLKMFGYEAQELIGKNVSMIMPDPHQGRHDTYLSNYLTTGAKQIIGTGRELMAHDSKYERVHHMLTQFFAEHPTEKVVLFSTFRETLNYLGERLHSVGISNLVMHGGVKEPKENILAKFHDDPSIRMLLSSEIGSEGIDLQFCRVLINYDLPWNPMRVEQRIGRLDRLGQKASQILIWNLLYAGTIDDRIYKRLYEKLDLCRQALGDFEAVLGDEIRKLEIDLLSGHLTPEQQESRIDQAAQALENLRKEQEQLESEAAHLVAYGDYILNQVHAAHDMKRHITGNDLQSYVIDFFGLHYPGCNFKQLREDEPDFDVKLSAAAKEDLDAFVRKQRLATPTRLLQNVSTSIRCRFENKTVSGHPENAELINQFHPLVRFVSESITEKEEQLNPAVSVTVPSSNVPGETLPPDDYVLTAARWSVEGLQASEKLVFAAASLSNPDAPLEGEAAERLANAAANAGADWFDASRTIDLDVATRVVDGVLLSQLEENYNAYVEDIRCQNEDRVDLQLRNLRRHLNSQRSKLEKVREKHLSKGRNSLVKATEGRILALEGKVERQELGIEKRRNITYRNDEIVVALIRVT